MTNSLPKVKALTITKTQLPYPKGPFCFTEAYKSLEWRRAICEEFNALLKNGMWDLVEHKDGMNVVGSKWVFKIKQKLDGTIEQYKVKLVAKGFHQ